MNLRSAVRLAISASLMAGSTVLFAQDRIDEIVVTGASIRDSQAAAIEAKRNAFNVKDVISADTVGRFPDQNLADSLGRLPGVAIERDQGQARFINFRGAPTRWTSISFDGIDVLGADNGRTPRFDSFPSVITRSIEASKAIINDYSLSDDYVDYLGAFLGGTDSDEGVSTNPYVFMAEMPRELLEPLMASHPIYIETALKEIETHYGSVLEFIRSELEVSNEELMQLRNTLLE